MRTCARNTTIAGVAAAVLLLAAIGPATARADDPVRVRVEVRPAEVAAGGTVTVLLTAEIEEGYHIYGVPPVHESTYATTVAVSGPAGFEAVGETRAPKPEIHADETIGEEVEWYTGKVVFEQDVRVPAGGEGGRVEIVAKLDFMACTDQFCLDPATLEAKAFVNVVLRGAPLSDPGAAAEAPGSAEGEAGDDEEEGLGTLIWAAFVFGLGSILLPCIYPLIPLTVAFFTKHEGSRAQAVTRAVLFCVGIMFTFTAIGIIVGPALQALATSLWLNVFLFALMVVLALSLFGMFDIRLPSSWTDRMQALGSGASLFAPVFMGVAFSLASFTCVVGFIGPVLAGASSDWGRATASMFSYSVGFALPFFVLALFPMLLSSMPKAGGWMNSVKVMLGFFEVCFAGYYLWRVDLTLDWGIGTFPIILSLWIVTIFCAGLYLLGKIRLPHDSPVDRLPVPRLLLAIVFLAFGLFLFAGLMGKADLGSDLLGLLPPRPPPETAVAFAPGGGSLDVAEEPEDEKFHLGFGRVAWTTDYEHGLEVGRTQGRRILLNFTGIFCTNCREMEQGLLPQPEVREELQRLVLVELWTDIPSDAVGRKFRTHTTREMSLRYRELRNAPRPGGYATVANPHYVILAPDGRILADMGYTRDADEFLGFLRTGKESR